MLVNESSMTPVSTLRVFSDKAPSYHAAVINHTDCDCGQIPDSQVMRWLSCYKLCVVLLCIVMYCYATMMRRDDLQLVENPVMCLMGYNAG